jgi:lambda repressor-like predicted transcriptional regulator
VKVHRPAKWVRVLQSYCNHVSAAQRLEKIIAQAEKGTRPVRTTPLPRPNKQFRPADVGAILDAWHDGNNIAAISRSLGFDYGTVRKYLLAAGIDTSTNPLLSQRDRDIMRLHEEGKTTRQIAKAVGCSHSTASVIIRKYRPGNTVRPQAAES